MLSFSKSQRVVSGTPVDFGITVENIEFTENDTIVEFVHDGKTASHHYDPPVLAKFVLKVKCNFK